MKKGRWLLHYTGIHLQPSAIAAALSMDWWHLVSISNTLTTRDQLMQQYLKILVILGFTSRYWVHWDAKPLDPVGILGFMSLLKRTGRKT